MRLRQSSLAMPAKRKPLEWSDAAASEFVDALAYIADESPYNATLVKNRIAKAVALIEQFPGMGKPGAVAGTREYPVPRTRHTLIYEEAARTIFLLHCWHQSRQR
jgi:toxin ParE1/3/4